MSRNIKKKIKNIIYNFNYQLLLKNVLLLESNPDFSDNTFGVYEELVRRNIHKKIKIIWITKKQCKSPNKDIYCLYPNYNVLTKIKYIYYTFFAKYIIDCNNMIHKRNKYQFRIHLMHGSFIKDAYEQCVKPNTDADYINLQSDVFESFTVRNDNVIKKDQISVLGYPRNDYLFERNFNVERYLKQYENYKIIVWMPTYRNHKNAKNIKSDYYNTGISFKYGIPTVETEEQLIELNNKLEKQKIILFIRLHPVEDTSEILKLKFNNIVLLDDNIMNENGFFVYQFLHYSDALITDYSSIYYDYLLLNKPIGLAIPDLNEYCEHAHIVWDSYADNIIGEIILSFNELLSFVDNVAHGKDNYLEKRNEAMKKYNKYLDDKSSKRVVDFFLNKINRWENK